MFKKFIKFENIKVFIIPIIIIFIIISIIIFYNFNHVRISKIKASSGGRDVSIIQITRNNWLHPFRKMAIIEFQDESKINWLMKCELNGVDMIDADAKVVANADSDEIDYFYNSVHIFSLKY